MFKMFFTDEILDVVRETNRYARQKLEGQALDKWQDVTLNEIKAFLGVCIVMGVNSLPSTADYWSSDPFLGNEGIQKVMTKNRFENISRFFHFNDKAPHIQYKRHINYPLLGFKPKTILFPYKLD